MKTLSIAGALGVLAAALSMLVGGCSSAPASSNVTATTDQKISMVGKVPMSPVQREHLIERIRSGTLKKAP